MWRVCCPIWLHALQTNADRARIDPDYARIAGGILAGMIPASEAVSFRIIGSTVGQAALLTGFRTVINMLREPRFLAKVGLETAGTSFKIAYDIMCDPINFIKWGFRSVAAVTELAIQFSTNAIESPKKHSAANEEGSFS